VTEVDQWVESPLQGNLHGGFGGGGEETQCGCASCPYLTESGKSGSEGGVRKHSLAVRLAPTLLHVSGAWVRTAV
jgi:hypothetical protein